MTYECFCQECGELIPLAEGETEEEQEEWFNEEDELKLCFDCEEDDKEQCVGLDDGKCVGKKIYKSAELNLGMCQECMDYMEKEANDEEPTPKKYKFTIKNKKN